MEARNGTRQDFDRVERAPMKPMIELSAVRAAITAEPWSSVALAFAAGACLAAVEPRSRIGRAVASTVGAIVLAALRTAASRRIAAEARSWIDARFRPTA